MQSQFGFLLVSILHLRIHYCTIHKHNRLSDQCNKNYMFLLDCIGKEYNLCVHFHLFHNKDFQSNHLYHNRVLSCMLWPYLHQHHCHNHYLYHHRFQLKGLFHQYTLPMYLLYKSEFLIDIHQYLNHNFCFHHQYNHNLHQLLYHNHYLCHRKSHLLDQYYLDMAPIHLLHIKIHHFMMQIIIDIIKDLVLGQMEESFLTYSN